jgi:magnesium chelatase subunit H
VTITHLTPPLAAVGALQGAGGAQGQPGPLARDGGRRPERADLETLIAEQADAVDMGGNAPEALWLKLLETEDALIPEGLHVVGKPDERWRARGIPDADGRCR